MAIPGPVKLRSSVLMSTERRLVAWVVTIAPTIPAGGNRLPSAAFRMILMSLTHLHHHTTSFEQSRLEMCHRQTWLLVLGCSTIHNL